MLLCHLYTYEFCTISATRKEKNTKANKKNKKQKTSIDCNAQKQRWSLYVPKRIEVKCIHIQFESEEKERKRSSLY